MFIKHGFFKSCAIAKKGFQNSTYSCPWTPCSKANHHHLAFLIFMQPLFSLDYDEKCTYSAVVAASVVTLMSNNVLENITKI